MFLTNFTMSSEFLTKAFQMIERFDKFGKSKTSSTVSRVVLFAEPSKAHDVCAFFYNELIPPYAKFGNKRYSSKDRTDTSLSTFN